MGSGWPDRCGSFPATSVPRAEWLPTSERAFFVPTARLIPGFYVAGNASAAVMGHSYSGAGSTVGPAMRFGYIAGNDI
jgi:hypothetical protein